MIHLHCPNARRVAVVSDTHGVLDPRIAELVSRCDCAVHAGDIGNAEVLDRLKPRSGVVAAVRGNNDVHAKWPSEDHSRLNRLPDEACLHLPGGDLVVVHGDRTGPVRTRHRWLRERYPEARAVVYGHSHRLTSDCGTSPWVLNPGAAGRARTYGGPSCLLLSLSGRRWAVEEVRFAALARG